jgi:hypothetical protein
MPTLSDKANELANVLSLIDQKKQELQALLDQAFAHHETLRQILDLYRSTTLQQ